MRTEQYLQCLKELENNPNIEFVAHQTEKELADLSLQMLTFAQEDILEMGGIRIGSADLECFKLVNIAISWKSLLEIPGIILKGGFVFNGITDALLFPTDDFKNTINIKGDGDYSEKLGWIERLPIGVDDSMRGCFIRTAGDFPPPVAFCHAGAGWYIKMDVDYYQYLELLFQNYGFKGWQYFYIDIKKEIPNLEEVLDDMRVALKTLPFLFPDKDWSYHQQRYEEVSDKMEINIPAMDLFITANPPITLSDLQEFETSTGLFLPEDYKAHLLQYNGAKVESIYVYFGVPDDGINFFYFYPLKHGSSMQVEIVDYLPEKHITIGRTQGGSLAMSLDDEHYGNIYVYYSEGELTFLASSFTAFVSGLTDYTDVME